MVNTDRFSGIRSTWITVPKLLDEARTLTSTLANDGELSFTMAANTTYAIRMSVFFDTAAAADFKYTTGGPASPTLVRQVRRQVDPTNLTTLVTGSDIAYNGASLAAGAGTTGGFVEIDMIVANGTTQSVFAFQWAQNTSNAGATTVRAGSYLEYRTIA